MGDDIGFYYVHSFEGGFNSSFVFSFTYALIVQVE